MNAAWRNSMRKRFFNAKGAKAMKPRLGSLHFIVVLLTLGSSALAQTPGTQKWAFTTGSTIRSSPAIGADGTVYVGSFDDKLYAINVDGTQKWAFTAGSSVYSSPAIGSDGTIYVGSEDGKLYAIDADGTKEWAFTIGPLVFSSPAIGSDGTVYVGSYDNNLYAIKPDGTKKWASTTGSYVYSSPAIGSDGIVYVGSADGKLYAIKPDGTQKWAFTTGSTVRSSPTIGADGTVYVGSADGKLYAINADGTQKWASTTGTFGESSPAIGSDGTVYVGSGDSKLYAIKPDGTKKWASTTGSYVNSSPAIGSDGTVYVGSADGKLYAIKPDGTQKWAFTTGSTVWSSPAIGSDGTVYVGSDDGKLYAIYGGGSGLGQTPWPKFHQNNLNTGRPSSLFVVSSDQLQFSFCSLKGTVPTNFVVVNPTAASITVQSCSFDMTVFSLATALPLSVAAGSSATLTASIHPDSTGLYSAMCQLQYEAEGQVRTASGQLNAGIFLEDNSETALTAHHAVDAYRTASAADSATVATLNNLGVLYRLLKKTDLAEQNLFAALSLAQTGKYGYTGIKMNIGVVKSDSGDPAGARILYAAALNDVAVSESVSVIAPSLYYNKSWEAYTGDILAEALTQVNKVLAHAKADSILKAKAYVLRGAVYYRQGDFTAARADFQQAMAYDPNGPIGRMAQADFTTGVAEGGEDELPSMMVLAPNYPNPFNPETTISFGLDKAGTVELAVYNVLGELVCTLTTDHYTPGWHVMTWNGTNDHGRQVGSGTYLLRLKAGGSVITRKMVLLR